MADRLQGAPVADRIRNGARAWYESLAPLRSRSVRTYLSGQALSLIGIWMQQTAQSWVVWQLSHSGAALGIAAMLAFLPTFCLGPWMGVFADRWDRRKVLIATQFSAMILAFVFAILVQTGVIALWHVFVLATLLGVVSALDFPSTQAFIGDIAGMSRVREAIILILPAVVSLVLGGGADMLGFLLASSGAGALVGAFFLTPLAQRARRTGSMLAANVVWSGVWLVLFSFTRTFAYAAIAIFFVSLTIPVVLTTANGLLQILAPPDMRGRVLSIFLMISFGAQPIAALLIGVAADAFTPMGAVLLNGALMVAAAGALVGLRSGWLSWEARQTMAAAAAGPPSR